MASTQDHLNVIKRNEGFLKQIRAQGRYPEWAVTVIFYIAVHYGRALLAHVGTQISSHTHFETVFLRTFKDRSCYRHIEILKKESEKSRYDNASFSWKDVDTLTKKHLQKFKECVRKYAKKNGLTL